MKVTVNIQDDKAPVFLSLVDDLDYAQIIEKEPTTDQQLEVLARLNAIDSGELKTRLWNDTKEDIFRR